VTVVPVVPAALLQRLGCLPETWPNVGMAVSREQYLRRPEPRDRVDVPLTPDIEASVCRGLAAREGHSSGRAYWLAHEANDWWRIVYGEGVYLRVVVGAIWRLPAVKTADRLGALLNILHHIDSVPR
jgi:hypothetical protein